jgi:hypothetical protein
VLDDAMDGFLAHLNRYTLADVTRGEYGRRVLMPLPLAGATPIVDPLENALESDPEGLSGPATMA